MADLRQVQSGHGGGALDEPTPFKSTTSSQRSRPWPKLYSELIHLLGVSSASWRDLVIGLIVPQLQTSSRNAALNATSIMGRVLLHRRIAELQILGW